VRHRILFLVLSERALCGIVIALFFHCFQVDKLIDIASAPPRGTGVHNIREAIIEAKMTFDVSADEWQEFLREKIMNNIERYFYMIVFAMYVREVGPKDFPQTFQQVIVRRFPPIAAMLSTHLEI